jgi:preprotein translocase subunit SecY
MLDVLANFSKYLPEIKKPAKPIPIKERILWTSVVLFLFFFMYNTNVIGVVEHKGGIGEFLQIITASKLGSFLTVGIGPIVFASILLQLLSAGGFFDIDLHDPKERVKFHEAQKTLTFILAFVEAWVYVAGGHVALLSPHNPWLMIFVTCQIALGAILLFYADELVSKYGIGSGVSLFIAAGVSYSIMFGLLAIIFGQQGVVDKLTGGGATAIPDALFSLLPFIFTIIIFLAVAYSEGMRVEIPLSHEFGRSVIRQQGFKFFYVSNIPVIFAAALLLNLQLFGGFLGKSLANSPFSFLAWSDANGRLQDGLLYLITPIPRGINAQIHFNILLNEKTPIFHIPEWVHAIGYVLFLTVASIFFGKFWAETQGMDAESVAKQLAQIRLQIPGYRRDPRLLERVLKRYIDPLVIVSSAAVGLLAGCADLLGALGTGTGILLTVGIFYNFYEQLQMLRVFDIYPQIGQFFK